ncbi:hypothetical protein [Achromobacter aegrifaciens]|uniref:hypothetical protein n=1 Tax=Achromobacter aegrifaciens TaxID=1287736 RepID=UPI00320985DF
MGALSILDLVTAQHQQAGAATRRDLTIDYPPAYELARACNSIFGLVDRDDDRQREIPRLAWRLKLSVLQTLLPFDDERLGLCEMAKRLSILAEEMPVIEDLARSIDNIITEVLAHPKNPKLERVAPLIGGADANFGHAILAGLQGAICPGWPSNVDPEGDFGLQGATILRSRRDVQGQVFSRLIVPGTLRFMARPLTQDLIYGGRAGEIVIAAYRGERIQIPAPLSLPRDTTFSAIRGPQRLPAVVADETPDEPLDKWVDDSLWERIRAQHPDVTPTSDRDIPVSARFVLFADSSGAFLPEDRTVVEVSELLDGNLEADADRLPRKPVYALDECDLVLLRMSGSGDYLDEVADTLMAQEGRSELRTEATAWKSLLYAALKQHGEGVVARTFRERGGRLRSAGYLWVWAGDAVIAPQSYDTFQSLTATLSKLVPSPLLVDPDAYAETRWEQMELVKSYQHRAGGEIRTALLERVRRLIAERQRVETVCSISLPGVEAGEMGLLRVSAVDAQSIRVPYSKLFQIHPVEVM